MKGEKLVAVATLKLVLLCDRKVSLEPQSRRKNGAVIIWKRTTLGCNVAVLLTSLAILKQFFFFFFL